MNNKPLIIIAGPTAVGKSDLGVALAKRINGEIISADSMQVYKYMDIGTAKVDDTQKDGILHHLLDILEPTEDFDVVRFKEMASYAIEDVYSRGKVPIVVGGTGFYIQALLYDIDFTEEDIDKSLRDSLLNIANEKGNQELYSILKEEDELAAHVLHPNDTKRIIRAIEFKRNHGTSITKHNIEQREKKSPYDFYYFVLNDDREKVYSRIDKRVDIMIELGLEKEVKHLLDIGCEASMTSMQGIGYKQILASLRGEYDINEAIRLIKRDSRHFAKRQITWFKREKDAIWINRNEYPDTDSQVEYILKTCYYLS